MINYSDIELEQMLASWSEHPITKEIRNAFKNDMEALLLGQVPKYSPDATFEYSLGHKDGQLVAIYKVLKPDIWFGAYVDSLRKQQEDAMHGYTQGN